MKFKVSVRCGRSACRAKYDARCYADADLLRQIARAPVGEPAAGRFQRQRHDPRRLPRSPSAAAPSRLVLQAGRPASAPAANPTDLHGRISNLPGDSAPETASAINNTAAPDVSVPRELRRPLQALQFEAITLGEHDRAREIGHSAPSETAALI